MRSYCDTVIVGSGPINMIEAVHQARNGSTVLLLDEKPFLGGAWYTKNHWGLENLEVVCHKIENLKAAYDLIESLGIEMFVMDPQPQVTINGLPKDIGLRRKAFYVFIKTLNCLLGRGWGPPADSRPKLERFAAISTAEK